MTLDGELARPGDAPLTVHHTLRGYARSDELIEVTLRERDLVDLGGRGTFTGSATVTHHGRNSGAGSWHQILTFTFTAEASGSKQVQTLEHGWTEYKSDCSGRGGTGARVLTTMTGV